MNKPKIFKDPIRVGCNFYVPAVEYETLRIWSEFLERKLGIDETVKRGRAKPIIWNEQTFPSLSALARLENVETQNIRYYINKDLPFRGSKVIYLNEN